MVDNGNNNGNGESGQSEPSLQETLDTTRGLLDANLEAGVPAQEALENSRPQSWSN
jgi:hypothetical protein